MKIFARLRRGFTLIELLIVIVIIGILAVGLVPKVIDAPKKARDTVRKTDLNAIKTALESYYSDYGKYPTCASNPCPISNTEPAGLASYFQGSKVPTNVMTANPYYYRPFPAATPTCYLTWVTLESASAGNLLDSASLPANCGDVKNLNSGNATWVGPGKRFQVSGGSF